MNTTLRDYVVCYARTDSEIASSSTTTTNCQETFSFSTRRDINGTTTIPTMTVCRSCGSFAFPTYRKKGISTCAVYGFWVAQTRFARSKMQKTRPGLRLTQGNSTSKLSKSCSRVATFQGQLVFLAARNSLLRRKRYRNNRLNTISAFEICC